MLAAQNHAGASPDYSAVSGFSDTKPAMVAVKCHPQRESLFVHTMFE